MPCNCRASCYILANRAFWASLGTDRIWVYSPLNIKCQNQKKKKKDNRLVGKALTSASVVGLSSRPVAQ